MRWIKGLILAVILLIVLLVGILFAVNNQQAIALNLIWTELPAVSLSVWLLATLTLGVVVGMIAMLGVYVRLRAKLVRSERHNKQQRKELDRLRTQEFKELVVGRVKLGQSIAGTARELGLAVNDEGEARAVLLHDHQLA